MVWLFLFEGSLALLAIGLGWLFGIQPAADVQLSWQALAWGIAATLPLAAMLPVLARSSWPPLRRLISQIDEVAVPLLSRLSLAELALLSMLAGLGEELLFRGLLQGGLAGKIGHGWALLASSLIFGLCHALTRTYAVLATLIGLWLGGLWLLAGNLLAPMLTHALYDFFALIYLLRWRR